MFLICHFRLLSYIISHLQNFASGDAINIKIKYGNQYKNSLWSIVKPDRHNKFIKFSFFINKFDEYTFVFNRLLNKLFKHSPLNIYVENVENSVDKLCFRTSF